MGSMTIRNIEIELDFLEELEPYVSSWGEYRVRDNKLQACSPFRQERRPSFAVNLENGSWIDSGAVDDGHKKGHFTALLSFLREETWADTEDYLLDKYSIVFNDVDSLLLELNFDTDVVYRVFTKEELDPYMWRVKYLENRGISEEVQRMFKIGYDKELKAVMIPWADKNGNIINLKFRSITGKRFWYHAEGQRIKQHVFGLNIVHQRNCKRVFCTESETDAMYLWTLGVPAVAFGSANMSTRQRELILRSPIEELVIATDNDGAGNRFAEQLVTELGGHISTPRLVFPQIYKDVNDIPKGELYDIVEKNVEYVSKLRELRM